MRAIAHVMRRGTRIGGLLLAIVCAPLLVACGGDKSTPAPASTVTVTSSVPGVRQPTSPTPHPGTPGHQPANGYWDSSGQPVNGGPAGADGSTRNGLTQEYCARNQDPGCPARSYIGPSAIPNPDGSPGYTPCEGTICTNPNHGAGADPNENGNAVMPNPNGDGQSVPCEGTICTNPNHGAGTDPNENGSG